MWHYLRDHTFSRFHTTPECDRHTHRQTDGQIHDYGMYHASIASRGKNRPYCTEHQVLLPGNEADQEKSVTITYLNDNAQIPLNRFVVYMLYKQVCNKNGDKSNRWNLGLSLSVRRAWPQAPYVRHTAVRPARHC